MSLRIGDRAPDFEAQTTKGKIDFHEWLGDSWGLLFSHPKDFTPVCTTELGYLAKLAPEFAKRNCKVLGLSVDPVTDHQRWLQDIQDVTGFAVDYPLIGDDNLAVAKLYDMLPADAGTTSQGRTATNNQTVRTVYLIGPDKLIKAMIVYPMIADHLHLSAAMSGVFIGGSIHEVAQVVGAGYSMSRETGDVATIVKLMRVAMLLPIVVCAAVIARRTQGSARSGTSPPLLPWFAVAFLLLAWINSIGWIGGAMQSFTNDISRGCLIVAMSAIGMKTQLKQIVAVGLKPVVLMIGEALFLAGLVLLLSRWL